MKLEIICSVLLLLLLLNSNDTFAQKNWRLEPSVGLQFLRGAIADDRLADPTLGPGDLEVYPEFGLMIRYRVNNQLNINVGWKNGGAGYGFDFKVGNPSSAHTHTRSFTTLPVQRFPIKISYLIKAAIIDRSITKYGLTVTRHMGMDIRLTTGFSIDYIVPTTDEEEWSTRVGKSAFTGISFEKEHRITSMNNRYGSSAIVGIKFDFHNFNKHLITLNFNYSFGLGIKIPAEVKYKIGDKSYEAKLQSRGSFFCVSLSYPIQFFKPDDVKNNAQLL